MAHAIPELINLTDQYNKLIKQSYSNKPNATEFAARSRSAWISKDDNKVLDKPIQMYRMWYRFLQLALELEEKGVQIITVEKRIPLKTPKKDAYGHMRKSTVKPIKHRVKVNRKAYARWDLDVIPKTSFEHWWKGNPKKEIKPHRQLFLDDSTSLVNSKDDWIEDNNYQYVRFDKRKRSNDIMTELRNLIAQQKKWKKSSISDFPITGNANINTLYNRFNALIVKLTTVKTDEEIFQSNTFRITMQDMVETKVGNTDDRGTRLSSYHISGRGFGRQMRDLIFPAKISLLSVCDGYFLTHPTKTYI